MTEPVARLFERLEGQTLPANDLAGVHRQARRIVRRRLLGAVSVTACAVTLTIGAVQLTYPDARGTGTPATPTYTEHRGKSADGLLLPGDLGPGWMSPDLRGPAMTPSDASVVLPRCATGDLTGDRPTASTPGRARLYSRGALRGSEWRLTQTVSRPDADAERITARLRQLTSCLYTIDGQVLAASDTMVLVGDVLASGEVESATGYAWSGGQLIILKAMPGPSHVDSTGIPGGTAWLARLLATAAERATGEIVAAPAVRPDASRPAVVNPPTGYLTIADLGATGNWRIDPASTDDRMTSPVTPVELPSCTAERETLTAPGGSQVYRGSTEGGSGEWYLSETVVTLTRARASSVRAALTQAGRCTDVSTIFGKARRESSGTDRLVLGVPLDDGRTGFATAWALKGDTLIHLETLPGGAVGGAALPGGGAWLTAVLETAVQRAN